MELPEDFSVCPARLYLGRDVCYDGFCAPGNQFPVLITKSRPGRLSAGRPGRSVCRLLCFVETSLIDVQLQRNTSAIMNNQCPAAIQLVSKRPQQLCAASLTPCYRNMHKSYHYFHHIVVGPNSVGLIKRLCNDFARLRLWLKKLAKSRNKRIAIRIKA